MPYPTREAELEMLARHEGGFDPERLIAAEMPSARRRAEAVAIRAARGRRARRARGARATSPPSRAPRAKSAMLSLGASPRATVALIRAARAAAVLEGRDFVTPDDVKDACTPPCCGIASRCRRSSRSRGGARTTCSARCSRACARPSERVSFASTARQRSIARRAALAFVPTRRLALARRASSRRSGCSRGVPACRWIAGRRSRCCSLLAARRRRRHAARAARPRRRARVAADDSASATTRSGAYRSTSRWARPLVVELHDALPAARWPEAVAGVEQRLGRVATVEMPFRGYAAMTRGRGTARRRRRCACARRSGLSARTLRFRARRPACSSSPSLRGVRRFRWLAVHHRLAAVGVRSTPEARRGPDLRQPSRLRRRRRPAPHRLEGDRRGAAQADHARVHDRAVADGLSRSSTPGASMTQLAGAYPRFEYALSSALVLTDVARHRGRSRRRAGVRRPAPRASCRRSGAAARCRRCARRWCRVQRDARASRTTRRRSASSPRASASAR